MLSFVTFETDRDVKERWLRSAHLIGAESIPVAGEIFLDPQGVITCDRDTEETVAFSVQLDPGQDLPGLDPCPSIFDPLPESHDAGDGPAWSPGRLVLRTCLLPTRSAPYLLSLELARHRLMLFLNCLEEWRLSDTPPGAPVMRQFERARSVFTEALSAHRGPDGAFEPEADRKAWLALCLAVEAGERLALLKSAQMFKPRMDGSVYARLFERVTGSAPRPGPAKPVLAPDHPGLVLPSRPAVGASVSPGLHDEIYRERLAEGAEFISMPMRWIDMEPSEGRYAYADTDRWIEWAVRNAKIPVVAGPLIEFAEGALPEWVYIWESDYSTLRELVHEHVRSLVTRYRRTISRWTVASGLHTNEDIQLSLDQVMDLTKICLAVVRKLHPRARVQIEIAQPWGEAHSNDRRALPPTLYAEMLVQAGVVPDAFSLKLQMGAPRRGAGARDLMELSVMLDQYAMLDRPIAVSAFGVPSTTVEGEGGLGISDPPDPGSWRGGWDPETQADWLEAAGSIILAKPFVQSLCWHELGDASSRPVLPTGGLFDSESAPKPAFERLVALRDAVHRAEPTSRVDGLRSLGEPAGAGG